MQRMTRQRTAVLEELEKHDEFRSAQQVYEALSGGQTRVSLATVYRNLQALSLMRKIDTLHSKSGEVLYRRCQEDFHHHHLICSGCGAVKEVTIKEMEACLENVASEQGFLLEDHSIEIYGQCRQCQERKSTD